MFRFAVDRSVRAFPKESKTRAAVDRVIDRDDLARRSRRVQARSSALVRSPVDPETTARGQIDELARRGMLVVERPEKCRFTAFTEFDDPRIVGWTEMVWRHGRLARHVVR